MLWTLGLILLGGAVLIGLAPRPLTFTVLGLTLSVGFAALLLWFTRQDRLVRRNRDGSLPPLVRILTEGVGGVLFAFIFIRTFTVGAFTNQQYTTACLCTRVDGLATAGWYSVGLLVNSVGLAAAIVLIVGAVARIRFAVLAARERRRQQEHPRPEDPAPSP